MLLRAPHRRWQYPWTGALQAPLSLFRADNEYLGWPSPSLEAGTVNPPGPLVRHTGCLTFRAGPRKWTGILVCPMSRLLALETEPQLSLGFPLDNLGEFKVLPTATVIQLILWFMNTCLRKIWLTKNHLAKFCFCSQGLHHVMNMTTIFPP